MSADLGDLPSALARLGLWSVTICMMKCVNHTAGQVGIVCNGYAYWTVCVAESVGMARCAHYTLSSTEKGRMLLCINAEGYLTSKSCRRRDARYC